MTRSSQEEIIEGIYRALDHPFWIPALNGKKSFVRIHDDHEGTCKGKIGITIGKDSDVWVGVEPSHDLGSLRFRTSRGGGNSQRVRNALLILALAIKLDNEEHPQNFKSKGDS